MRIRQSFCYPCFKTQEMSLDELCRQAAAMGYAGVELWFRGEDFGQSRVSVSWGPLLPRDAARLVSSEQVLVQGGIHSRRRAMAELGVRDPEAEFRRWLEERRAILEMNRELATRPARSGARERVAEAGAGVGDE